MFTRCRSQLPTQVREYQTQRCPPCRSAPPAHLTFDRVPSRAKTTENFSLSGSKTMSVRRRETGRACLAQSATSTDEWSNWIESSRRETTTDFKCRRKNFFPAKTHAKHFWRCGHRIPQDSRVVDLRLAGETRHRASDAEGAGPTPTESSFAITHKSPGGDGLSPLHGVTNILLGHLLGNDFSVSAMPCGNKSCGVSLTTDALAAWSTRMG